MYDFNIKDDGFCGFMHKSQTPWDEKQPLIVVGGTEAANPVANVLSSKFARECIDTIGMKYWDGPGLPKELVNVPLDPFAKAVSRLKDMGYERIGIYGFSRGAEVALLVASLIPEITRVCAVSPSSYVRSAQKDGHFLRRNMMDMPAWTWKGEPIPYAFAHSVNWAAVKSAIKDRELSFRYRFEVPAEDVPEEAMIPVEKINGDIMLQYAEHDTLWPTDKAVESIQKRLNNSAWDHDLIIMSYPYASHVLVPVDYAPLWLFQVERKYPNRCAKSRMQAFEAALRFFQ